MYDHGLRFLLTFMPTLLTLCRSFARTYRGSGSLSTLPWTPHQLTAEVYPHRVSTSVSAWDYLASTHANTSTVKHSGPASLPRKSQAARNRVIPFGQAAATFFRCWELAFCLCIHKQCEHICMYTQPVHTSSSVYTHMSIYLYVYIVGLSFAKVLWLHIGGAVIIHSTELTARNNVMQPLYSMYCYIK